MRIDDPRIEQGWLAHTAVPPEDLAAVLAWRDARPEFSPWTLDWFSVECAPYVVADDFDAVRGSGSALLFRTRARAERFAQREPVVASGVRPLQAVWYVDVSRLHVGEVVREEYAARLRCVGESLAAVTGAGQLLPGVLFAPRTDAGAKAIAAALDRVDELQAWARRQEVALVEEAEGARA